MNNINGGSSQDCCALDCPTTEQGCIKQTCCQNSNKVSFSILIASMVRRKCVFNFCFLFVFDFLKGFRIRIFENNARIIESYG